MSMTETGLEPLTAELSPAAAAALARIRVLAREKRRVAAINKRTRRQMREHAPNPAKARKPYFYNPANRD